MTPEPCRVAVTGLGAVSPAGIGREELWRRSLEGGSCVRALDRFDARGFSCRVAGQVDGFRAADFVDRKTLNQTDRSVHMAIAGCRLAAEDAGYPLEGGRMDETGMCFASLFGGMEFAEPELYAQCFLGPERVSAYQAIAWFYAAAQGQWSIGRGIRGFGKSLVADRAGGLQALAWATLSIQRGHCAAAFAGGFEAPLSPYVFLIHHTSGLLSTRNDDPSRAYRPFDAERSGMVLGEGCGILLLEELERARGRGAPVYAEVAGFSVTQDAAEDAGGWQLARCLAEAVERAGLAPEEIDHVCAEGLAVPLADRAEVRALDEVFAGCAEAPTLSAPKALTGHTLAAAGALDAIWSCLMIRHGTVLPTPGLEVMDPPSRLEAVRGGPRAKNVDAVLCCNRGHGGLNTAVVLRRPAA